MDCLPAGGKSRKWENSVFTTSLFQLGGKKYFKTKNYLGLSFLSNANSFRVIKQKQKTNLKLTNELKKQQQQTHSDINFR